jgi:NAD(P)H-dependent flavin oxidoreductase YrpB (nitropropane dioxygenase family)
MKSELCEKLGIEFPIFAFNHCRDVVVEVSKAGGMGILGAAGLSPEALEIELKWIDDHIDGKPYGVDIIVPTTMAAQENDVATDISALVPNEHRDFASSVLAQHGLDTAGIYDFSAGTSDAFLGESKAAALMDVAFAHPIKMIANALGVPPRYMLELGKANNVAVAALVGAKEHALKQAEAGVDVIVVQGTEAGGHCGEVSTMVLVPEVCEAIKEFKNISVLAAGGIVLGRQMAAAMTMGAHGAWTGSMWLTTSEASTSPVIKEKMLSTNSRDTVRSRSRTGKYSRQMRSPWTDAWDDEDAPDPLPMPLQPLVSEPALSKITKMAEGGHPGARQLATYWVGQGVGLMNEVQSCKSVMYDFMQDFLAATEKMRRVMDD